MNRVVRKLYSVENPVMYIFTLEGLGPHKIQFQYTIVRPSNEFHSPSHWHGHGSWPECKVALRAQTMLCFDVLHMLVQDLANTK